MFGKDLHVLNTIKYGTAVQNYGRELVKALLGRFNKIRAYHDR